MTLDDRGPLEGVVPEYANLGHSVWDEIAPKGDQPGFLPKEFEDPAKMEVGFLRLLHKARLIAKVPFRIIDTIRGDPKSAHGEVPCACADLQVMNSFERSRVVRSLYTVGFVRVGVYPGTDGPNKKDGGGIHVDASRTKPQDRLWTQKISKDKI